MRRFLLHFQVFNYSDTAFPMNRFLNCTRYFPNIKFSIVKFSPNNEQFWEEYGETVEELTFNSCMINKPEFIQIVRLCPNLRMLSVTRCEDLYKSWLLVKKLPAVRLKFNLMKTLVISDTSLMTKSIFKFMVASAPNITSLTLSNCFGDAKPQDRVQILDALIEFITSRPEQIKTLNLSNTHTDELFLEKLADIEKLKLIELRFTFNGVVSTTRRSGVLTLLRNQRDVQVLDVSDSKGLSNFCLMEICKYMQQLQKLLLAKCWLINDVGLREVRFLPNLMVLDVSSCDRVTDLGLLEGLTTRGKKNKLKELHVGLLPYMSITSIYRLALQYDQLEVLDLSGSSNSMTDEAIQIIFRYQTKLRHLNLDCCGKLTDYSFTGISENIIGSYCQYNINRLSELRYLNLGGCYQIGDNSFYNAFDLIHMKEINLSRCHNITEVGYRHLIRKCPNMTSIDLSECYNVSDGIIQMITKDIVRLETLKLNGCTQITSDIFYDIAYNSKYLKVRRLERGWLLSWALLASHCYEVIEKS